MPSCQSDHEAIEGFFGEYRWLSNFALVDVVLYRQTYPTVENAFQASKSLDLEVREIFCNIGPLEARELGRQITPLRDGWDSVKDDIMLYFLRQKYRQPLYRDYLLATAERPLIEVNTWHDEYWGVCRGRGMNHLGRLIMLIRTELTHGRHHDK